MRFALIFLLTFLPLGAALFALQGDLAKPERLPEDLPDIDEAVISGKDLASGDDEGAFTGRVLQLEGVKVRVVEGSSLKAYARFGKLVRHEGRTRVTDVLMGLFDDGKLDMTIEAPFVEGDARRLIDEVAENRVLEFGGGVVVRDAAGRPIARVKRLAFDLDRNTVTSNDPIALTLAEKSVVVDGVGVFADLDKKTGFVRIEREVAGTLPTKDGNVRFRCKGPATVREEAEGRFRVALKGGARIEHPVASADAPRIEVVAVRDEQGRRALKEATLSGGVAIELDQDESGGIERLRARTVHIEGEVVTLKGGVSGIRRGPLERFGMGERTLAIKADEVRAEPVGETKEGGRLWLVRATGMHGKDEDGPGGVPRGRRHVQPEDPPLRGDGRRVRKTGEGSVAGTRLVTEIGLDDEVDLLLEGRDKRIDYVADGKLGPLSRSVRRGTLVLRSAGPVRIAQRKDKTVFTTRGDVRVALDKDAGVSCGRLTVVTRDGQLSRIDAHDGVVVFEKSRGGRVEGAFFTYRTGGAAVVRGTPAHVRSDAHGRVRAKTITWFEDGRFVADGDTVLHARLQRGKAPAEPWVVHCGSVRGKWRKDKTMEAVRAAGGIRAVGPAEQLVSGDSFVFDGKAGIAVVKGDGERRAHVRRGKELELSAPEIELTIRDKDLAEARTRGKASVAFRAEPKQDGGQLSEFARWEFEMDGDAVFSGEDLLVERGGRFAAFDRAGKKLIAGFAKRVVVTLRRVGKTYEPVRLRGENGVMAESFSEDPAKVVARTLDYTLGSRRIRISGNVRIRKRGIDPAITFKRADFVLTKDGVDLRSATGIKVKKPAR